MGVRASECVRDEIERDGRPLCRRSTRPADSNAGRGSCYHRPGGSRLFQVTVAGPPHPSPPRKGGGSRRQADSRLSAPSPLRGRAGARGRTRTLHPGRRSRSTGAASEGHRLCSRDWSRPWAGSIASRTKGRAAGSASPGRGSSDRFDAGREHRRQRLLPDGRRGRGRDLRRPGRARDPAPHQPRREAGRRPGEPGALAPRGRPPGRPLRPGARRHHGRAASSVGPRASGSSSPSPSTPPGPP